MRITKKEVKIIRFNELSDAIKEELCMYDNAYANTLFFSKVPQTIEEVEEKPLWNDLCRQLDLSAGEQILIKVEQYYPCS